MQRKVPSLAENDAMACSQMDASTGMKMLMLQPSFTHEKVPFLVPMYGRLCYVGSLKKCANASCSPSLELASNGSLDPLYILPPLA